MDNGWPSLPVEIRQMILFYICEFLRKDESNNDGKPPYTPLPLVCREFHYFFAHMNFRVLALDQHRFEEFERIVSGNKMRQSFVEQIYLRVRLPWNEGESEAGDTPEKSVPVRNNEAVFIETVRDFMAIMSRWKKRRRSKKVSGIKLHLGATWPSTARELFTISPAPTHQFDQHATQRSEAESFATSDAAPGSQRTFAPAPIFDGITILRCHPPCISPGFLDQLISEGMPRLKKFQHQSWDILQIAGDGRYRDECFKVLDVLHRNKVRTLDFFHNSGVSFHPCGISDPVLLRSGFNYAILATGLRFCCMSSFNDSATILTYLGDLYFPELEYLVLKSRLLTGFGFNPDTPDLVKVLALIIFSLNNMPKLKGLDIWKGDTEYMFLVRVVPVTRKLPDRQVTIAWYSNWLEDDELREPFENLRRISLTVRWRLNFRREQYMEPARDPASSSGTTQTTPGFTGA